MDFGVLLDLYVSFLQVGLFSLGGGFAALPLIEEQIITNREWLTQTEFNDILAISQMTPGPIAINASVFVGTRMAGIPGSIVATLGCVTAPVSISLIMVKLYTKYKSLALMQGVLSCLRPAVVALISVAGLNIFMTAIWDIAPRNLQNLDTAAFVGLFLFVASFFILRKFKLNPVLVMLFAGVTGLVLYFALGIEIV
ncbi:MAG: chromate transporter [Defluviitaleaceae bacterium]|nr:chromate transporter [Defluviitaleaceae bacterium]